MTVRTKAGIEAQIQGLLLDNTTGQISAPDMRSVLQDILDSLAFLTDVTAGGGVTLAEVENVISTTLVNGGYVTEDGVNALISTFIASAVSLNTETRISVAYDSSSKKLNFVVVDQGGGVTEARVNALIEAFISAAVTDNTETNIQVTYTGSTKKLEFVAEAGAISMSLLDLTDTPDDYGDPGDALIVNAAADALIFSDTVGIHAVLDSLRYVGWSDDRVIATGDLAGAASSMANEVVLPARAANGYIYFAIPEALGWPHEFRIGPNNDQLPQFEQLAGTVDDAGGEPHIIGVTRRLQAAGLAGLTTEFVF